MILDSTSISIYLAVVFAIAALTLVASTGVVVREVARNRSIRLAHHQSVRTYYGCLALHH